MRVKGVNVCVVVYFVQKSNTAVSTRVLVRLNVMRQDVLPSWEFLLAASLGTRPMLQLSRADVPR